MPTITHQSRIRAASDYCNLTLCVRHRLVVGSPSDILYSLNETRFLENVDTLSASNLVITVSGIIDGSEVPAKEVVTSSLSQHLVDYFQMNAAELGLGAVSGLYLDDEDGLPELTLTPLRRPPVNPDILPVHVVLVALDLCFSWKTPGSSEFMTCIAQMEQANHPFSRKLSLPYRTVLDNVMKRFVTWQLVRRYPLTFGPWCQQLDIEALYFSGIFSSISSIVERSPNVAFRRKYERYLKILHSHYITTLSDASASLSMSASFTHENDDPSIPKSDQPEISDEDVLCWALERAYRSGLLRPQFKGYATFDPADDADLSLDDNITTECVQSNHHLLWCDPLKAHFSEPMRLDLDTRHKLPDVEGLLEDEGWSDLDEFTVEHTSDRWHLSGNRDHSTMPVVLDCLQGISYNNTLYLGMNTDQDTMESEIHLDHAVVQKNQNSQGTIKQRLGIDSSSQAVAPLTSLMLGEGNDIHSDAILAIDCEDMYSDDTGGKEAPVISDSAFDDDLDLGVLSDTDSILSSLMETGFEDDYDLEQLGGASVDLVTQNSHQLVTLGVTCTLQDNDHAGYEAENKVPWQDFVTSELGRNANTKRQDLDEDVLFIMDF